jgi:hypothetical protein
LAIAIAYGAGFCYLAGKLSAFKAQFDPFVEGTCRYLAELIIFSDATLFLIWTRAFGHSRAFFASDSTYAYSHFASPHAEFLSLLSQQFCKS